MTTRLDRKANFLDFVPVPLVQTDLDGKGMTVLLTPKFKRRFFMKLSRAPFFRLHLDEVGTFIWSRCDGKASVGAIAAAAREQFAEKVEPAEERTAVFFRRLLDARAVRLDSGANSPEDVSPVPTPAARGSE